MMKYIFLALFFIVPQTIISEESHAIAVDSKSQNFKQRMDTCITKITGRYQRILLPRFKQHAQNNILKYEAFFAKDYFYLGNDANRMALVLLEFMDEYAQENHDAYLVYKKMYTPEELYQYINDVTDVIKTYGHRELTSLEKYSIASIVSTLGILWPRVTYLDYLYKSEENVVLLEFFTDLFEFVDKKIK